MSETELDSARDTKGATGNQKQRADRPNSYWYKLYDGAIWSMVYMACTYGGRVLLSIICARILGQVAFGQLAAVQSTVSMLATFAGAGLGLTATKYVAQNRQLRRVDAGEMVGLTMAAAALMGMLLSVLQYLGAGPLARLLGAGDISEMIRIAAPLLLLGALDGAQAGSLARFEAFRLQAAVSSILAAAMLVGGGVGAKLYGVNGAIVGQVIASAVGVSVQQIAVRRVCRHFNIPISYRVTKEHLQLLWKFSLPTLMCSILVAPINWLAISILMQSTGNYVQLAIFNAATQFRNVISFLPTVTTKFTIPILARLGATNKKTEYREMLDRTVLLNVALAAAVALPLGLASRIFMSLFGKAYADGWLVLTILAASGVLAALNSALGNSIIASGNMWFGFLFNAAWATTYIIGAKLLVGRYEARGLALAVLFAYALHTVWQGAYYRHLRKLVARVVPSGG